MADDDDLPPVIEETPEPGIDVVMPSDLSAEARAPSGMIVRQLTEEERQRYPVERPTREDLLVARAAGLNTLDVARQFGKSLAYVEGVARHYRIGIKAGHPDPERRTLRKKIEEEMAAKGVARSREETKAVPRRSKFDAKLTKEFLEAEIQRRSAGELGKIVGCSDNTIGKYLKKFGIENPWLTKKPAPKADPVTEQPKPAPMLSVADLAASGQALKRRSILEDEAAKARAEARPTPTPVAPVSRPAKFHRLIDGMLDELPSVEGGWSARGLDEWLDLMRRVLRQVYKISGADQPPSEPAA